jgi:hypothetical protein
MQRKIFLISLIILAFSVFAKAQSNVKIDSDTISGLGARNIGSAAMSGRVSAVDGVQEGKFGNLSTAERLTNLFLTNNLCNQ